MLNFFKSFFENIWKNPSNIDTTIRIMNEN